jgi:hypothetical protein
MAWAACGNTAPGVVAVRSEDPGNDQNAIFSNALHDHKTVTESQHNR